jgi:hypothetical protein
MEDVCHTRVGAQHRPTSARVQMGDKVWFDIFANYMLMQLHVISRYVRTELDLYLEEPLLPRTHDLYIIRWRQHARLKYPTL